MIDTFLFDIGNVLVTFDFTRATHRLVEQSALTAEEMREILTPLVIEMETGRLDAEQFIDEAMTAVQFTGERDLFRQAYNDIFEANGPMIELVAELSIRHPLYLLSNTSALHLEHLRLSYPVFSHFRGGVYSHEARSMKPEEAIFLEVIKTCSLEPSRTLYVDDSAANTASAARLGFQTFTYDHRRHEDLLQFLRQEGVWAPALS